MFVEQETALPDPNPMFAGCCIREIPSAAWGFLKGKLSVVIKHPDDIRVEEFHGRRGKPGTHDLIHRVGGIAYHGRQGIVNVRHECF